MVSIFNRWLLSICNKTQDKAAASTSESLPRAGTPNLRQLRPKGLSLSNKSQTIIKMVSIRIAASRVIRIRFLSSKASWWPQWTHRTLTSIMWNILTIKIMYRPIYFIRDYWNKTRRMCHKGRIQLQTLIDNCFKQLMEEWMHTCLWLIL